MCRTVKAGIPCEEKGACNFDLSDPWLEDVTFPPRMQLDAPDDRPWPKSGVAKPH